MGFESLHETAVKDVVDTINNGISDIDDAVRSSKSNLARANSLSKATSGLNLVFPVLCTKTLPIETASMIAKAVERKAVTLLQVAFSAYNITNSKDAVEFVQNFHTNLNAKTMSLDDFIGAMDSYAATHENAILPAKQDQYNAVMRDLRNINYCFGSDISESSINDYKVRTFGIDRKIIKEAISGTRPAIDPDEDGEDIEDNRDRRIRVQNQKDQYDMFKNQLLPTDVKKANEMVPTMMVINFITTDEEIQTAIDRTIVIGVKGKLYPVDSTDVMNKIITKNVDGNILLKLVKVSTREISFVKDFLFAIDNAKLNAVANSKNGSSTNRLLKVLERRALNGKIRKALKTNNAYKAISTLVISQEEADMISKEGHIDVSNTKTIRPIMEKLNLMMFIIADESSESVNIIMDTGDDIYETLSYTNLEREASDNSSKKAINLMTKLVR